VDILRFTMDSENALEREAKDFKSLSEIDDNFIPRFKNGTIFNYVIFTFCYNKH